MQGPQLRQRTFFVRHGNDEKGLYKFKIPRKKHLFLAGDHTFLGINLKNRVNLYQVYKISYDSQIGSSCPSIGVKIKNIFQTTT